MITLSDDGLRSVVRNFLKRLTLRVSKLERIFELDYDEDEQELRKDLQFLRTIRKQYEDTKRATSPRHAIEPDTGEDMP